MNKLIDTSSQIIAYAKDMAYSCQLKKKKIFSYPRFVVSFFLRRSWEMFESFIILIKERRIIDSAIILRSVLEMGISLGYIFSKDINEEETEIRAIIYMLDGDKQQLKLTNANLEGFKEFNSHIKERRDELKEQIIKMEDELKNKYKTKDWSLPSIQVRAELSRYNFFKKVYNQSYRDISNIEHHSMLFGQHYVESKGCDPILKINHLNFRSQLKPSVSLYLFRAVFIEIMNIFNKVFQLKWERKLSEMREIHEKEYKLLRDRSN